MHCAVRRHSDLKWKVNNVKMGFVQTVNCPCSAATCSLLKNLLLHSLVNLHPLLDENCNFLWLTWFRIMTEMRKHLPEFCATLTCWTLRFIFFLRRLIALWYLRPNVSLQFVVLWSFLVFTVKSCVIIYVIPILFFVFFHFENVLFFILRDHTEKSFNADGPLLRLV